MLILAASRFRRRATVTRRVERTVSCGYITSTRATSARSLTATLRSRIRPCMIELWHDWHAVVCLLYGASSGLSRCRLRCLVVVLCRKCSHTVRHVWCTFFHLARICDREECARNRLSAKEYGELPSCARASCFEALYLGCRTGFIFGPRQQIR